MLVNVPVGIPKIQRKKLSTSSIMEDIRSFMDQNSTGYFCLTINGIYGLEEGLLVIENGRMIGAYYEYLNLEKSFHANEGLVRTLNAFHAKHGIYDCFELSIQQIELLKIFNEDILFLEPMDYSAIEGMIPVSFSAKFEEELVAKDEKAREEILKERKLSEIEMGDYQILSEEMKKTVKKPVAPEKVRRDVSTYLTGIPTEEVSKAPNIEEKEVAKKVVFREPEEPLVKELKQLDEKAEELLKGIKGRKNE